MNEIVESLSLALLRTTIKIWGTIVKGRRSEAPKLPPQAIVRFRCWRHLSVVLYPQKVDTFAPYKLDWFRLVQTGHRGFVFQFRYNFNIIHLYHAAVRSYILYTLQMRLLSECEYPLTPV